MKRIKTYKIFESRQSGLTKDQEQFIDKHTNDDWDYDPETGLVNISGYFWAENEGLTDLMGIKFGVVEGDFTVPKNRFDSLDGFPRKIGGYFDCEDNMITTLEGGPSEVGSSYYCGGNQLKDLKGSPREVGGGFHCQMNGLESLEGGPEKVGKNFTCQYNQLKNLIGAPKYVGGDFICLNNPLENYEGMPEKIMGMFQYDDFSIGFWDSKKWRDFLENAEDKPILLTAVEINTVNQFIKGHASEAIKLLKPIWDNPGIQKWKKKLVWPEEYGSIDQLMSRMDRVENLKDFI